MMSLLLGAIELTSWVFWGLRVAAGIGGALVGWFCAGPVARVVYRVACRRAAPPWMLPWARLAGAILCGLLAFYFLPLGGSGGFGWGPGTGGGPGLGAGDGSGKSADKPSLPKKAASAADLETLEIEVIGGKRYQGDGRYYLIKRREPAVALAEVEDYLQKNQEHLAPYVMIVLTPNNSVDAGHAAVLRLNTIVERYKRKPQVKDVDAEPGK